MVDRTAKPLASSHGSVPRLPWVAASQYGMHFVVSQDNEILWRADWMPMEMLRAMVRAANEVHGPNRENHSGDINKMVATWRDMPSSEMRLRIGEMTAQEIMTVRAALSAILPKP